MIQCRIDSKLPLLMIFIHAMISYAASSRTSEYWNSNKISGNLSGRTSVSVQTEYRFGNGMQNLYYQHSHFEIGLKLNSWLTVSPAYRQVHKRTRSTTEIGMTIEHLPQLNLNARFLWKSLEFSNRFRIENIHKENHQKSQVRYRNRVKCRMSNLLSKINLSPFLSDEIFLLEERDGFYRNRFYIGVESCFKTFYILSLYLMEEKELRPEIRNQIFGTELQFKF